MREFTRIGVVLAAVAVTGFALGAHAGSMDHGSMKMGASETKGHEKGMAHEGHMGDMIHESTVEGYKFAYHVIDNAAQMEKAKEMKGMSMKGHDMGQMKSHHLMLYLVGPDGKPVEDAKVGYKVEGPGKTEQKVMTMGMKGGYGADVDLKEKGTYEIKAKAVVGGKSLVDEFKYEVK